jgi:hypothetical protein
MKTSFKLLYWMPRILCILVILTVSIFALDAFDPKLTAWQQILGFIMHLVPSFILIILLVVAWKWELIGGMIITILALGLTPGIFILNYRMNHSVWISLLVIALITLPFILAGILFILSHYIAKKPTREVPLSGRIE